MKTLLVILSALITFSAYSAPRVGDMISMTGTFTPVSGPQQSLESQQIILAYDSGSDRFTIQQTVTVNGVPTVTSDSIPSANIFAEERGAQVVAQCLQLGGLLETLSLPAGIFPTCRMQNGSAALWIAQVPFGAVKIHSEDATGVTEMTLNSFGRGP